MEFKISAKQMLNVLKVMCWIIFIGLCVEAGGILFNIAYTTFYNPIGAGFFWNQIDFSDLYQFDKGCYINYEHYCTIESDTFLLNCENASQ